MADRFPSIDEIDSGREPIHIPEGSNFLERERAVLGDDAAQFETPNDHLAATVEDAGDDNDFSGEHGTVEPSAVDDLSAFESQFPAIDSTDDHIAPGGTIGGPSFLPGAPTTGVPTSGGPDSSSYAAPSAEPEEELEVIKEWREKRAHDIATRDKISEEKRQATIEAAKQDLNDYYENYNQKVEKSIAQTRREAEEFLANRDDTTAGGTSWERIAKLVDLSGKGPSSGASGTGKERFREVLLSLKKDEKAPGASGI